MACPLQVSSTTHKEEGWSDYYKAKSLAGKPRDTLIGTVELFRKESKTPAMAVDLGCGSGNDTAFLVENGWKVIALDAEQTAKTYLFDKVPENKHDQVTYVVSKFEDFLFPHNVDLINASYSLPFCSPDKIDDVMQRITSAISSGGRFCGQFFGLKDSWTKDSTMVFHSRERVENYFKDFVIESIQEEEKDGPSGSGPKHWHLYHIIAKKV